MLSPRLGPSQPIDFYPLPEAMCTKGRIAYSWFAGVTHALVKVLRASFREAMSTVKTLDLPAPLVLRYRLGLLLVIHD